MKPEIPTKRTILKVPGQESAELLLNYYLSNRDHLSQWEPERQESFFTLEHWQNTLAENERLFDQGSAIKFAAFNRELNEVIGVCNFTNIVRGPFQACNLGYSISHSLQGEGYMFEILRAAIDYAFANSGLRLHRVMANYLPSNTRSEAILRKLGFEKEGYARSYIKIAGKWEDHVLTSLINNQDAAE
ncbi:MAG TPA: 30S ribosomal protein S5 alanine N-acetyltransferase [Candidatus Riflebacteria bacterium]|jgi:ribosomal-protein-alanine N-acetyltransferase|nr:30S ribosomal protein S5 alanine N-acetyltransferase [Candidatus Riflebacteria bacterium]